MQICQATGDDVTHSQDHEKRSLENMGSLALHGRSLRNYAAMTERSTKGGRTPDLIRNRKRSQKNAASHLAMGP